MIPNPMLILAVVLAFVANGFFWHAKGSNGADTRWTAKIEKERADATQAARETEKRWQEAANAQTKQHQAKISAVRRNLDVALDGLRDRPERPVDLPATARADCKDANGAELSGANSRFLAGLGARADEIRAGLDACYAYADSLRQP